MRRPEKSSSLFLLLLALAILYASAKLGLGTLREPGPGFLPFGGGAVLFLTSAIQILFQAFSTSTAHHGKPAMVFFAERGWRKVIYVILALAFYTFLLEMIGFLLCTFLLILFLLTVIEARSWYIILIESILIVVVCYIIFEKALMVGFPKGIFGF
jgi:putative tricarboxylic transport membrane protein